MLGGGWDCVYLVAVLGEVSDLRSCVREVHRILRTGSVLSLTEQPGDPDFIPLLEARELVEGIGFRFEKARGRSKNYTASFRKWQVAGRPGRDFPKQQPTGTKFRELPVCPNSYPNAPIFRRFLPTYAAVYH